MDKNGKGIADIGFGVNDKNFERTMNTPIGQSYIKHYDGMIVEMVMREQDGYGVVDCKFNYVDAHGDHHSTDWFTNN